MVKNSGFFDGQDNYLQFQDTIDYVMKYCKEHGPFDGIIGFSQGAALGLFLLALQDVESLPYRFKFAVSYSGFYPKDKYLQVVLHRS